MGYKLTFTISDCIRIVALFTTGAQSQDIKNGNCIPVRILGLIHND